MGRERHRPMTERTTTERAPTAERAAATEPARSPDHLGTTRPQTAPEEWVGPERAAGPRPASAPPLRRETTPDAPWRPAPRGDAGTPPTRSVSRQVAPAAPHPPPGTFSGADGATREVEEGSVERGATAPQLRRFIKSRAYVPMHELRRRFAINGGDDEVTTVDLDRHRVYVGLPEREGRLLAELLRGGDIGYELSLDPISPIVVGVYPMRPVTRA